MNPSKLKPFSLFLFAVFSDYLIFKQVITSNLLKGYGIDGISFFVLVIIGILFMVFVPKDTLKRLLNTKLLRILVGLSMIIQIIMLMTISINVVVNVFYFNNYRIIFMSGLAVVIYIISNLKLEEIINLSTSFFIFLPLLYLLTLLFIPNLNLYELVGMEFSFIKPLFLFNVVLTGMYLFCNNEPKKIPILLGGIAGTLLLFVEYAILICVSGEYFFADYDYLGFVTYNIQNPNRYIGNFDFITIISIVVCTIYCSSYLVRLVPMCFKLKEKYRIVLVLFLFILCSFFTAHLNLFDYITNIFLYIQTIILALFYLVMVGGNIGSFIRKLQKK